jgi:hypothetical protein
MTAHRSPPLLSLCGGRAAEEVFLVDGSMTGRCGFVASPCAHPCLGWSTTTTTVRGDQQLQALYEGPVQPAISGELTPLHHQKHHNGNCNINFYGGGKVTTFPSSLPCLQCFNFPVASSFGSDWSGVALIHVVWRRFQFTGTLMDGTEESVCPFFPDRFSDFL